MSIEFGATVFFNNPREFVILKEVVKNFPFVKYVEFRGEQPFCVPGITPKSDLAMYKQVLQECRLKSTLHSTYLDINLATLNPWLKDGNIACYKDYIDLAAYFESEVIVVHGGSIMPEFVESEHSEQLVEIAKEHLCESLTVLADYGRAKGVKVSVENLPPDPEQVNVIHDLDSHLEIIKRVDHPNLGAIYDLAHAYLYDLDIIDYLEKIRPHLFEIHAHNNMGEFDDHLGLTRGKIDFLPILKHPDIHDVPFIMEINTREQVLETLSWLKAELPGIL